MLPRIKVNQEPTEFYLALRVQKVWRMVYGIVISDHQTTSTTTKFPLLYQFHESH